MPFAHVVRVTIDNPGCFDTIVCPVGWRRDLIDADTNASCAILLAFSHISDPPRTFDIASANLTINAHP